MTHVNPVLDQAAARWQDTLRDPADGAVIGCQVIADNPQWAYLAQAAEPTKPPVLMGNIYAACADANSANHQAILFERVALDRWEQQARRIWRTEAQDPDFAAALRKSLNDWTDLWLPAASQNLLAIEAPKRTRKPRATKAKPS